MNDKSTLNITSLRRKIKYHERIEPSREWWNKFEKEEYPHILKFLAKELVSRKLKLAHIYTACIYSYSSSWLYNFRYLDFLMESELYKKYFLGLAIGEFNTDSERLNLDKCVDMVRRASIDFKDFTEKKSNGNLGRHRAKTSKNSQS